MGKVSANGLCSKQHILHLLYATLFLPLKSLSFLYHPSSCHRGMAL